MAQDSWHFPMLISKAQQPWRFWYDRNLDRLRDPKNCFQGFWVWKPFTGSHEKSDFTIFLYIKCVILIYLDHLIRAWCFTSNWLGVPVFRFSKGPILGQIATLMIERWMGVLRLRMLRMIQDQCTSFCRDICCGFNCGKPQMLSCGFSKLLAPRPRGLFKREYDYHQITIAP